MSKVLVSETNLVAIGDAIREKNGETTLYKPGEMAAAISAITAGGGGDFEIPVITGDCNYRFANNGWNWLIEEFGDKIETADINNALDMFSNSSFLKEIPFEINCSGTTVSMGSMFENCRSLTAVPKINNCHPYQYDKLFANCNMLREIPEDFCNTWDWSYIDGLTNAYSGKCSYMFQGCYSLRSVPISLLEHYNAYATAGYNIFKELFNLCCSLDEIVDLPVDSTFTISTAATSNLFDRTFDKCYRLKNIIFRTRIARWKSQVIDLSRYIGYAYSLDVSCITGYNSGITADKEVTDDTTYAALKDDPDWFTTNVSYSRYNHDSAVATINSLPDASSYLAQNGGTNTIKFLGQSGELTDGGAINTLTEEEIAVATAKGWTVSLV